MEHAILLSSHSGATLAFPAPASASGCVLFSAHVSVSECDGCDSDGAIASSPLERDRAPGPTDFAAASLSRVESVGGCSGVDLPASSAHVHVEAALEARALLAYSFDFDCEDSAVLAIAWELQGTRDGALWRRIDVRTAEHSRGCATGEIFPVAAEVAGAGWTTLRVVVRDVSGASGGHARRSRASFRVSRVCAWFSDAAGTHCQPRVPSWSLSVSGSAGLRRLRVALRDGSFDAVTLNTLPFNVDVDDAVEGVDAAQANAVAVARFTITLSLAPRCDGGCAAELWVNGLRAELVTVSDAFRAPLHLRGPAVSFLSAAAAAVVSSSPEFHAVDNAASAALGSDIISCDDFNDGRASLLRIGDTAGTGCGTHPFAALAFDAPMDSQLRGISGEISQIVYSCGASLASRRAALAGALAAGAHFAATLSSLRTLPFTPRIARPFASFEHVALWQPLSGEDPRRSLIPLRRRYAVEPGDGADEASQFGFSARSVACGYAPASGSLCLAAHDCGPAVYVEDAAAGRLYAAGAGGVTSLNRRGCVPTSTPTCPVPLVACSTAVAADEDALTLPPTVGHAFGFESAWSCIDAFVYFSHFRVSVPPRAWIDAAHAAGARALGCICTEWADGEAANAALVADAGRGAPLALALALIAQDRGFDGWLINIEAALVADGGLDTEEPAGDAQSLSCASILRAPRASAASAALARWLRALTLSMHTTAPASTVIWYDAVNAQTGRIQWASTLDARNALFLDSCDGLFLDYHWRLRGLRASGVTAAAAGRARDVFVGVDVWGRGTWGGGGWGTGLAAARARDAGLSVAVFAPAWVYETRESSRTSVSALREAEGRLWFGAPMSDGGGDSDDVESGDVDADNAGADTVDVSVHVLNASGFLLPADIALALQDASAHAAAAAVRHGWAISSDGGAGWGVDVEEPATWASRAQDSRLDDGSGGDGGRVPPSDLHEGVVLTSFTTSHAWCEKVQVVALPAKSRGGRLRVFEWARGAPPNVADKYRLRVDVLDAAQTAILSFDSGVVTLDGVWRARGVCWKTTPHEGVAVRVVHGGQDAECWAGHFGARVRGTSIVASAPKSGASRYALPPQPPSLADALGAPRSACAELPVETNFCAGRGAGDFSEGRATAVVPWVCAGGARAILPPRLGAVGNATISLSHRAAWSGGTSLLFRATGAAAVDVLAVSLRAPASGLSVEIIFQPASSSRLRPLLVLAGHVGSAPLTPSHEEIVCARGAWSRGTWRFDAGGALVERVRAELSVSGDQGAMRVGVRIGYIRIFAIDTVHAIGVVD